jgi:hypothetical protein
MELLSLVLRIFRKKEEGKGGNEEEEDLLTSQAASAIVVDYCKYPCCTIQKGILARDELKSATLVFSVVIGYGTLTLLCDAGRIASIICYSLRSKS